MPIPTSLIPGLDDIIKHGDLNRRAEAARRIAELYLEAAATLRPDHVDLFDGALINLVPDTEIGSRIDLAERLSVIVNAPRGLVGQLAREDEILIAGPLLRRSPVIDEGALIDIARIKGQGHLLAMSERPTLSSGVTDVIVRRAGHRTSPQWRAPARRARPTPASAGSSSGSARPSRGSPRYRRRIGNGSARTRSRSR